MIDPRILVLIPARMAATRLPGKPLADIAGLPMIVHVMRRAEAAAIGRVAVATDTAEIASVVNRAMTRLPEAEARLLESFHYDRCKMSQIAEAHGISERAVEGRLRRARERLRHELEITLKAGPDIA